MAPPRAQLGPGDAPPSPLNLHRDDHGDLSSSEQAGSEPFAARLFGASTVFIDDARSPRVEPDRAGAKAPAEALASGSRPRCHGGGLTTSGGLTTNSLLEPVCFRRCTGTPLSPAEISFVPSRPATLPASSANRSIRAAVGGRRSGTLGDACADADAWLETLRQRRVLGVPK